VATIDELDQGLADSRDLLELAEMEEDEGTVEEVRKELDGLQDALEKLEFRRMFSGEMDENNAYLDIQSGSGGTEAQDWANILLRMYLRWAESHGFKTEIIEISAGEVAGIKSASLHIQGDYAFGWLRTETGVHRLVRKSPFDSGGRRHTSFASVFVSPEIDDSFEVEINPSDLRVDTYRSSGAGGQHVNTTDSAVRITHKPTGVVVASQNDRSQHKNRATAMSMLKARLFEREMAEREAAASGEYAEKTEIGWGHQIRSYVLQPYQLVKDLRTGVTSTSPDDVLDGALDPFMAAALSQKVTGEKVDVEDVD